jgi:hypothetical protein
MHSAVQYVIFANASSRQYVTHHYGGVISIQLLEPNYRKRLHRCAERDAPAWLEATLS